MKRLIFPFLTLICLFAFLPKNLTDIYMPLNSYCYIFCAQSSTQGAEDLGNGYMVFCESQDYVETLKKCKNVEGVSVVYNCASAQIKEVIALLDAKIIFDLSSDAITDLYCRSAKIKGGVYIDGKLVNLQIFYAQGKINVGTPLLLGSY